MNMTTETTEQIGTDIDVKAMAVQAAERAAVQHSRYSYTRFRAHRLIVGTFTSEVDDNFKTVVRKACKKQKFKLLAVATESIQWVHTTAFVMEDPFRTERECDREMTRLLDELDEYYAPPE